MIKRSGYAGMDWLKALESRDKPKDPTRDLGKQNEADLVDNALETSAQIAFNLSPKAENKNEALIRSSKEIADQKAIQSKVSVANEIKNKIASNGIDPVALGIASTWETYVQSGDIAQVEKIATKAALEFEKQAKTNWEKTANQPAQYLSSKYDPKTMKEGRIMSATAANEETRGQQTMVPANANSILNPHRLDEFVKAENPHDKAVAAIKDGNKQRTEEKKAQYVVADSDAPAPMKSGQVMRAGGEDRDVFIQKTPRNQVSMLDVTDNQKFTPEQIKEQLSKLFTRIEDNGQSIKAANQERKESIQGKKEPDRTWETLQKPASTSDMARKLAESLWPSPKPDGQ